MKDVFDHLDGRKRQERARKNRAEFEERKASLTRLVKNEDFRAWIRYIGFEFCGNEFGTNVLDEATQGKRMAWSFIQQSLAVAEGGPELCGEMVISHFKAVGEAKSRVANGDEK